MGRRVNEGTESFHLSLQGSGSRVGACRLLDHSTLGSRTFKDRPVSCIESNTEEEKKVKEIGNLLPNNRRQRRTLLRIVPHTVHRVGLIRAFSGWIRTPPPNEKQVPRQAL